MYEIIPAGVKSDVKLPAVDELRYQQKNNVEPAAYKNDELMLVKLRYKAPQADTSQLISQPLVDRGVKLENASNNLKFSAAVAAFGMVLRNSQYKGTANFDEVLSLAQQSKGTDLEGYRSEFIRLVEKSKSIAGQK